LIDPLRLKQVLVNLLSNGVKFTDQGHVELALQYVPSTGDQGTLYIAVNDTGIGISPQDQKRLFQPFTQADTASAHKQEGTGLGLHIAYNLVAMMGGKIMLDSLPGVGSTFSFSFPTRASTTAPASVPSPQKESGPVSDAPVRILVADDVPMNTILLKALLRKNLPNALIETVGDGLEVLEQVRSQTFDLIFMDVQMPNLDGIDAAIQIRNMPSEWTQQVPIVALTAGVFLDDSQRCYAAGMEHFLAKPIDPPKLRALLLSCLAAE
jgi:CheY-like chemotaxis protein